MSRRALPLSLPLALPLALALSLAAAPAMAAGKTGSSPAGTSAAHGKNGAAQGASEGAGMDFADQKSANPLEIYADQGLELSQDAKTIIARVNAKAIRGNVTVKGDVLIAHYRDKQPKGPDGKPLPATPAKEKAKEPAKQPAADGSKDAADGMGGNSEVWRVEADGRVTISTPTQTAYGDHADYNIDDAVVVLTGKDLRMVTPTDVVTARDSLEYWEHRQQAVARGNAVAVRDDKRIQADILVADFGEDDQKKMAIQKAHAYDHVVLTTPREVVTGDRADYNVETGIVTVSGSVKITRDENQLNGGYAVVNLDTGISRIFPAAPGATETAGREGQVKGMFVPQKKGAKDGQGAGEGQNGKPDIGKKKRAATPPATEGSSQ